MSNYTVFGGRGFVGTEFVKQLNDANHTVFVPKRDDDSIFERDLGTIIYSAGYGDCKKDPYNVLDANVNLLRELLDKAKFSKLIYISSARVYMNQTDTFEDSHNIVCNNDSRRLFNLTKLVGEELCFKSNRNCTIIRPSNIYGLALNSPLFLPSIVRDSIKTGVVNMYVPRHYEKDYVSVENVVSTTIKLACMETLDKEVINIASGINVSAEEIANVLINNTDCKVIWHATDCNEQFEPIDVDKVKSILDYTPCNVLADLEGMINRFKKEI